MKNNSLPGMTISSRKRSRRGTVKVTCSKCGEGLEEERIGRRSYCRKCHNESNKKWKKRHKAELSAEEKRKQTIRDKTRRMVKRGLIIKKPCEVCGDVNSEIHHADYTKPEYVRWVCKRCHALVHQALMEVKMKNTWRVEYKRLYKEYRKKTYPAGYQDFPNIDPKIPSEGKANGLTQIIIKFLSWKGHYANRIGTQGQARIHKIPRYSLGTGKIEYTDKVSYTKSTTKRGTPDINAIIYGKAVWIEVKVSKDRMSAEQIEQKGHIEDAGGVHYVARDMQSFYEWYYKFIEDGRVS